jgi:hypothetical protein
MSPKPSKPEIEVTSIEKCPSCGGSHIAVEMLRLDRPNERGSTHRGICPVTGAVFMGTKNNKPLFVRR